MQMTSINTLTNTEKENGKKGKEWFSKNGSVISHTTLGSSERYRNINTALAKQLWKKKKKRSSYI